MKRRESSNGFIRHSKHRNRRCQSRNEKTKAKFSPASPIDTSIPDADAGYAEPLAAGLDKHQAVLHCSVLGVHARPERNPMCVFSGEISINKNWLWLPSAGSISASAS